MLSFEGMWSKTISQMITVTVHISNICSDLKKLDLYNEYKEAEWGTNRSDREKNVYERIDYKKTYAKADVHRLS